LLLDPEGKGVTSTTFLARRKTDPLPAMTVNQENIIRVQEYLLELANYTSVIWLGPRIELHISETLMLKVGCDHQYTLDQKRMAPFLRVDKAIKDRLRGDGRRDSLVYLSQIDLVDFDMGKDFTSCSQLYWSDGDHWSAHGERLFGHRLSKLMTF
jgi:hypothetical protein